MKRQIIPNRYGAALSFLALLSWELVYKGLLESLGKTQSDNLLKQKLWTLGST